MFLLPSVVITGRENRPPQSHHGLCEDHKTVVDMLAVLSGVLVIDKKKAFDTHF